MRRVSPHQEILDTIRALDDVTCQNRLLRVSDTELALSLLYMSDWQQDYVLSFIGEGKAARVRQELERHLRSRIEYGTYELAARVVKRTLEGASVSAPRSWYRPARPSRRGAP